MCGTIITYEESGVYTGSPHRHRGYSSGFSPSRDQWREHTWETVVTRPTGVGRPALRP